MRRSLSAALVCSVCIVAHWGDARAQEASEIPAEPAAATAAASEPAAAPAAASEPSAAPAAEPSATSADENLFVADQFTNEFIGAQLVVGSVVSALGISLLSYSAVSAGERDDVLEPVGGVTQCDQGNVDPALCVRYRELDDRTDQTLVSGAVVLMTGVVCLMAALTAWGVSAENRQTAQVIVAPLAGPEVAGVAAVGRF